MSKQAAKQWLDAAAKRGMKVGDVVDRPFIKELMEADSSLKWPTWLTADQSLRVGRGQFRLPEPNTLPDKPVRQSSGRRTTSPKASDKAEMKKKVSLDAMRPADDPVQVMVNADPTPLESTESKPDTVLSLIPTSTPGYVPFGHFKDVTTILEAKIFYPVFVTGMSGNGKTLMIQEIAARLGRDLIRVNFTEETDEDDLIGGFRLESDGNGGTRTVWHDGPVIEAMVRGAILLLDEVDYASSKILSLQSVLEGKALFVKKIGKLVHPAAGFNVVATANTKGKGDNSGRYMGANVLNDAFLERFPITLEQDYASAAVEEKILVNHLGLLGLDRDEDKDFAKVLSTWADNTRKTFRDGGIDEQITTRRNVFITEAYAIFKDREKAVKMNLARFDEETQSALFELYRALDASKKPEDETPPADDSKAAGDEWWAKPNEDNSKQWSSF